MIPQILSDELFWKEPFEICKLNGISFIFTFSEIKLIPWLNNYKCNHNKLIYLPISATFSLSPICSATSLGVRLFLSRSTNNCGMLFNFVKSASV